MKRYCQNAKRTRNMIYCRALKDICVYQYWKICIGAYELTEAALKCPKRNEVQDESDRQSERA